MEMASIGFLLGAVVAVIFVGIGVMFGDVRNNKAGCDADSDMRVYVPCRNRSRRRDHRRIVSHGEKAVILTVLLHTYKNTLTTHEKDVIQLMIDELKEAENDG